MANRINFVCGNSSDFYSSSIDDGTIYFLEDTQQLYKGSKLYGSGLQIIFDTFQNWLAKDNEVIVKDTILVYTDRTTVNGKNAPDIKITDGVTAVGRLPFITDGIMSMLGMEVEDDGIVFNGRLSHSIAIGDNVYDGSSDVVVPIYNGE